MSEPDTGEAGERDISEPDHGRSQGEGRLPRGGPGAQNWNRSPPGF